MSEKYQPHPPYERDIDRWVGVQITSQMSDIVNIPEYGLLPTSGFFDSKDSRKLSEWTVDNRDNLRDIIGQIPNKDSQEKKYSPEEITDGSIKLLELLLKTPNYVYAQDVRDNKHINSPKLKRRLVEYGETVREVIYANPDMEKTSLIESMQGAVLWARLPIKLHHPSTKMFREVISGASGEIIFEQLATSPAALEAGIIYGKTDSDDDLGGIDIRLVVPIQIGDHIEMVPILLDVKNNPQHIRDRLPPENQHQTFVMDGGRALIWPGVTWKELGERLMLDEAGVEEKAADIIPVLQEIARLTYEHERNILEHLGDTATQTILDE